MSEGFQSCPTVQQPVQWGRKLVKVQRDPRLAGPAVHHQQGGPPLWCRKTAAARGPGAVDAAPIFPTGRHQWRQPPYRRCRSRVRRSGPATAAAAAVVRAVMVRQACDDRCPQPATTPPGRPLPAVLSSTSIPTDPMNVTRVKSLTTVLVADRAHGAGSTSAAGRSPGQSRRWRSPRRVPELDAVVTVSTRCRTDQQCDLRHIDQEGSRRTNRFDLRRPVR